MIEASRGPMLALPDLWYALHAKLEIWSDYAMIRVPRVIPSSLDPNFGHNDELARLEAERNQLRAVIAQEHATSNWVPSEFQAITLVMIVGFGLILFLAEYIAATGLVWTVVIGGVLVFILTRRLRIFGKPYYVGVLAAFVLFDGLPPVADPNARDLLADCEYKISKLKDNLRDKNSELR
jgi:hypothetical protein